jgi:fructose-bisphosphate aldolase / 2-amino-3,7-dideoxy-D-threo-hept-6-ulosonate synthase
MDSMSSTGVKLRLNRLFADDGKCGIVALDHGSIVGPQPGWIDPKETLEAILSAQPDGIITTIGIIDKYIDLISHSGVSVVLTMQLIDDVESLIRLAAKTGVDGIKVFVSLGGTSDDASQMNRLAKTVTISHSYGIPVIAEMYPTKTEKIPNPTEKNVVAKYSRIGMEHGADVIKTFYTGSGESFKEVVAGCPIPVLILGGEKTDSEQNLLKSIGDAVKAGAAGAAIGRNVWQSKDPKSVTTAIMKVIHDKNI